MPVNDKDYTDALMSADTFEIPYTPADELITRSKDVSDAMRSCPLVDLDDHPSTQVLTPEMIDDGDDYSL